MFVNFKGKNNEVLRGEVIQSEPRLKRLVHRMSKVDAFAFDTETNTLRVQAVGDLDIVGISISFGKKDNYYIPIGHFFDDNQLPVDLVMDYLRPQFERLDVLIIAHNAKFDMHVMACYDVNIRTPHIWDTMIASWCIDENEEKGLKHLTDVVYDVPQEKFDACLATITKEERKAYGLKGNKKPPFLLVRIPVGAPYAIADAYWTWRHFVDWQLDMVEKEEVESIYNKKMIPFLKTLYNMERRGVRINKDRLKEMSVMADKDLAKLQYAILEIAGIEFNIGSSQQLGEILFGYKKINKQGEFSGNIHLVENNFGFPIKSTTDSGAPSTGESALQALIKLDYKKDKRKREGQEMLKLILKYKKLNKLKSAFIDGLLSQVYPDGRIHPTFNLGGASSGRLSCIAKDSLVKVVGGDKPIQDVKTGDYVYCYDSNGKLQVKKVLRVMNNGERDCIRINWRSQGTNDKGYLICTPEHRVYNGDLDWVRADSLKSNDQLVHLRHSNEIRPRLYGYNKYCEDEQVALKRLYFGVEDSNLCIHHLDGNPSNNISNLTIMSREEHTRQHSRELVAQGRTKVAQTIKRLDLCINHRVESIEPYGRATVYDLEVEDCHNFIANEICVHNCSEPNLQQLPRPIEMTDHISYKEWAEENGIKFTLKERKMFKYLLKCEKGFYTGEIDSSQKPTKNVSKYLEYLKSWREKNEENLMWKYYEIRDAIMSDSEDDRLIAFDYSNLEMRLLAHFSQDPKLLETFIQDHDSHGATAVNMFSLDCSPDEAKKRYKSLRQIAKTINFMLMYGGGASTLFNTLSEQGAIDENGDPITREKAQEYYDKYFEAYDGVKDFIKNQHKYAHKYEMIYTLIGRKRRLPEINKGSMKIVSYLERLSVNACIQGSGADVMIMVQPVVEANKRLKELNCSMRLQVHDELVFNCPKENVAEAIPIIKDIMEHPFKTPLNVPLRVDSDQGKTYAEAK